MKKLLLPLLFLSLLSLASAYDLSDFPEPFLNEDEINTIIVVGDKAPSSHVLAQTQLALWMDQHSEDSALGISKLASEVDSLEQNIISIGNPCDNEVTARISGDPSPCDDSYPIGKAYLRVYTHNGYTHIVAAGLSERGTTRATQLLKGYRNYELGGDVHTLIIDNDELIFPVEDKTVEEEPKPEEQEIKVEEKEEPELPLLEEKDDPVLKEEDLERVSSPPERVLVEKEEQGIINRIFTWLFSFFS